MDTNNKISSLLKYVEHVKQRMTEAQGEKKAFWERELRKTLFKINSLTK